MRRIDGDNVNFVLRHLLRAFQEVAGGADGGPNAQASMVVLGGIRVPIGPMAPGFEIRWQSAKGNLSTDPVNGFSAPKIDLGGVSYLFTFGIRF